MVTRSRRQALAPRFASLFVILLAACQPTAGSGSVGPSLAVATPPASAGPSATAALTQAPSAAPVPTPTKPAAMPRPTDIPTNGACEAPNSCLGLLAAGSHHTVDFKPGFAFTMPAAGWENLSDEGGILQLLPLDAPGDAIAFFREPKATTADGSPVLSVDISVDAIGPWLAGNKDLRVGPMSQVSIGGLKGIRMEIEVAPGAAPTTRCPVASCVAFFVGIDPAAVKAWQWDWGVATSERMRLDLLSTADGGVIAIFVDSADGTTYDALVKTADTILATVKFDKS